MDGLSDEILTESPGVAVLISTAYRRAVAARARLESGAKGYILKEAPHQTLLRHREGRGGEGYVDPALMPAFLTGKDKDEMLTTASGRSSSCSRTACPIRSRCEALHQSGDGEEPCPHISPSSRRTRGRKRLRLRSRSDHRLERESFWRSPRRPPGVGRAGVGSRTLTLAALAVNWTRGSRAAFLIVSERRRTRAAN